MRLVRFGSVRQESWGALDSEGRVRVLPTSLVPDKHAALSNDQIGALNQCDLSSLPEAPATVRLGCPVAGCGKIVCIGLNYRAHAEEAGMAVPTAPVIFMKATSAISGPYDDVLMPKGGTKLDWEAELGVVIGRSGVNIEEVNAKSHIAGYCIVHDVSERAFQLEGTGQWVKGKSADTFAPMGPWFVTHDEIRDPQDLGIWLKVNGITRQDYSTRHMIVGIDALVSYVSRFMSLHPGDVISTGTPPGVGHGMTPPTYLSPGDVVELGIEGLGTQRQTIVEFSTAN